MAKAVLVMDMPDYCGDCPVSDFEKHGCAAHKFKVSYSACQPNSLRPDWCPLIPEPEKHAIYDDKQDHSADYYHGWNACIDALEGEGFQKRNFLSE